MKEDYRIILANKIAIRCIERYAKIKKKNKKKYKIGKERGKTEIFEKNEKVIIRNYNPVITISPVFIDSWNYRGGTRFRLKFSPMFYTIGRRRERKRGRGR